VTLAYLAATRKKDQKKDAARHPFFHQIALSQSFKLLSISAQQLEE